MVHIFRNQVYWDSAADSAAAQTLIDAEDSDDEFQMIES